MLRLSARLKTSVQAMTTHIERWALGRRVPDAGSPRAHFETKVASRVEP